MLQLPHDEPARVRRTRSEISSQRSPNNTALSTSARQTYSTGLKTLTSTGSSEGSVSTDEAQSSPIPTAVAPETLKQKPKVPPKPSKRHGVFLETADLAEEQVCSTWHAFLFRTADDKPAGVYGVKNSFNRRSVICTISRLKIVLSIRFEAKVWMFCNRN